MTYAPIARILLRYGVGITLGMEAGSLVAGDPDLISVVAIGVGALVEVVYTYAKKRGWAT